ncbi:MAG: tetratricopeptide repeat protein [Planctomycetaceae bacterium]|nr:tetratricopeptide repeat protein [Planctomycetaceae bacterium]
MTFRLTRFVLCGCLLAACGCQNPLGRTDKVRDTNSVESRFSFSSDDPSPLDRGRGHSPSLASEMADFRRNARDNATGIPGGSSLTVKRLLERGYDADTHGRSQEARMYYEQILAEDSDHPEAHHRLGILADQSGDFQSAEHHYQVALRSKPRDADVLNDLGYSYFLQGRAAESEQYLNQALQVDPKHPHVQENLSLLYDQAKAEKVLLSQMGPSQTQATMAQLFQNGPGNLPVPNLPSQPRFAQRPLTPTPQRSSSDTHTQNLDTPEDLLALQRKMEEARMQSISERHQRNAPQYPPTLPDRMANRASIPPQYQPPVPPGRLPNGVDVPDGHINDVFRNIDTRGHSRNLQNRNPGLMANRASQVPVPQSDSMTTPPRHLPSVDARSMTQTTNQQRAEAPQWNTTPQQWPGMQGDPAAPPAIEQTRYSQRDYPGPQATNPSSRPSVAERAAEIGMSAGPGAMFPQWNTEVDDPSQHRPMPAMRSMPGTHSRMNGSYYQQPSGSGVPSNWDTFNSAPEHPTNGVQPGGQFDNRFGQSNFNAPNSPQSHQGFSGGPTSNHPYDQMRSQHNSQFNQDQHHLAASPSLMTNGHPSHEPIPGRFDPNRQDWPAYSRDQYDTRNMPPPSNETQQSRYGQGQFDGQNVPQFNPSTQSAPQNYGQRW